MKIKANPNPKPLRTARAIKLGPCWTYIVRFLIDFPLIHVAQVAVNTKQNKKHLKITGEKWFLIPVKRSTDRGSVAGNIQKKKNVR